MEAFRYMELFLQSRKWKSKDLELKIRMPFVRSPSLLPGGSCVAPHSDLPSAELQMLESTTLAPLGTCFHLSFFLLSKGRALMLMPEHLLTHLQYLLSPPYSVLPALSLHRIPTVTPNRGRFRNMELSVPYGTPKLASREMPEDMYSVRSYSTCQLSSLSLLGGGGRIKASV